MTLKRIWTMTLGTVTAVAVLGLLAALALGVQEGLGVDRAAPATQAPGQVEAAAATTGVDVVVDMQAFRFHPSELRIAAGTTVTFVNQESVEHNVVGAAASTLGRQEDTFRSPHLAPGESWQYTFDEPGVYPILCDVGGHHLAGMVGEIVVTAPGDAEAASEERSSSSETATGHEGHTHQPAEAKRGLQTAADALPMIQHNPGGGEAKFAALREAALAEGRVKEFTLDVQEAEFEIVDGVKVTAWAFNGELPGPELRMTEGDLVKVHFDNTHDQPHTIHFHGIHTVQAHDGVPELSHVVMPGEQWTYEFIAPEPGTHLYHCHFDTFRHLDLGMYGAIVVEPREGNDTYDREYTLILDDWDTRVDIGNTRYDPRPNYFTINGKAFPDTETLVIGDGERVLVRLINLGYEVASMHTHGTHFRVVATDGYPLPAPYMKDTLTVGPGERFDLEITGNRTGTFPFHAHNLRQVTNDGVYPGGYIVMLDFVEKPAEVTGN